MHCVEKNPTVRTIFFFFFFPLFVSFLWVIKIVYVARHPFPHNNTGYGSCHFRGTRVVQWGWNTEPSARYSSRHVPREKMCRHLRPRLVVGVQSSVDRQRFLGGGLDRKCNSYRRNAFICGECFDGRLKESVCFTGPPFLVGSRCSPAPRYSRACSDGASRAARKNGLTPGSSWSLTGWVFPENLQTNYAEVAEKRFPSRRRSRHL